MDSFSYSGINALVTGASRGLGLAFLKELSLRGVSQIYAGCRDENGIKAVNELNFPRVVPILLDVTNPGHFHASLDSIDKLDLLINNAGTASATTYTDPLALQNALAEMNVHYFGPLALVQALLPMLRQSNHAGIINIASIAAIANFKSMGTYSASKAAIHFLTQGLRAELAGEDIFVQGVYPGPFDTRLAAGFNGPKLNPSEISKIILDGFGNRVYDVFPDEFSKSMNDIFLGAPHKLQSIFSS